ncbi:hypothetical protein OROMI_028299 [Orobanche minor]
MSTVFHLVQDKQSLPVSHTQITQVGGIRRRLSSISLDLKIQPSSASVWALRPSKSISSIGSCMRKWWELGWGWILSRKPTFATDLEMNDGEIAAIGSHSWGHVCYRVTSQLRRKFLGSDDNVGLPQTFRYDSINYSNNNSTPSSHLH